MPLDSTKKWAKKSLHKLLRASQKEVKKNSKIRDRTDMIFSIMVLVRHLVMYWAITIFSNFDVRVGEKRQFLSDSKKHEF